MNGVPFLIKQLIQRKQIRHHLFIESYVKIHEGVFEAQEPDANSTALKFQVFKIPFLCFILNSGLNGSSISVMLLTVTLQQ